MTAQATNYSDRRDVFLFGHPRTASNLLCRVLSKQPDWTQPDNSFMSAWVQSLKFRKARQGLQYVDGELTEIQAAQRGALDKAQQAREEAAAQVRWSKLSALRAHQS